MDDSVLIIFGTETGNAEDVAVDIGNMASKHGLHGFEKKWKMSH